MEERGLGRDLGGEWRLMMLVVDGGGVWEGVGGEDWRMRLGEGRDGDGGEKRGRREVLESARDICRDQPEGLALFDVIGHLICLAHGSPRFLKITLQPGSHKGACHLNAALPPAYCISHSLQFSFQWIVL